MRTTLTALVLGLPLLVGCAAKDAATKTPVAGSAPATANPAATPADELKQLVGEWKCVRWEWDGKPVAEKHLGNVMKIAPDGKVQWFDSAGASTSTSTYTLAVDPAKTPKTFDIKVELTGTIGIVVGTGKAAETPKTIEPGIYKLEGNRLTLCRAESNFPSRFDNLQRPKAFQSEDGVSLQVYERLK